MRYPAMGKSPSRAVSVPALSGGVNLNDALNLVDDNQMTECKNVWYKDGLLQTRPALGASKVLFQKNKVGENVKSYFVDIEQFIDGEKCNLIVIKEDTGNSNGVLTVCLYSNKEGAKNPVIITEFNDGDFPVNEVFYGGKKTIGEGIYMLTTEKDGLNDLYEMVTATDGTKTFQKLTADNLYSPTIYINGKGDSYSNLPASTETSYAPASFFEGHSALSQSWSKYYFTSDGVSTGYTLPIENLKDVAIKIEIYDPEYAKKYTFNILNLSGNSIQDFQSGEDKNVIATTNPVWNQIILRRKNEHYVAGGDSPTHFPISSALNGNTNNIQIQIKFPRTKTNLSGMRFGTWFGGAADGISGGTRFFVAGSKENPNLLMWSDLNNPTYFSENNEAAIGEETQSITALKKQSNMLVIFKEHELFYSVYSEGSSYTAEDVVAGRVIDVSTASATFPMITIHSEIGCDLPESIQLCGDRLVWACKDRHVYMLKNANQYSTANVAPISASVDRRLRSLDEEDYSRVKSYTYQGHYVLVIGKTAYVLNYDYYYFANLPAYSDSKKTQRKLIWYVWEFPPTVSYYDSTFISTVDVCSFLEVNAKSTQIEVPIIYVAKSLLADGSYDIYSSYVIESVFQTKLFDFGAMDRFKKIEQLYMGFGNTSGEVLLEYVTDKGSIDKGAIEITGEADKHSPQYVITKRFLPGVNRALRFGIRVTAKGKVAVDGILIKYKYLGVTR